MPFWLRVTFEMSRGWSPKVALLIAFVGIIASIESVANKQCKAKLHDNLDYCLEIAVVAEG